MAHELDITDGIASFADSRTDAWHGLGQHVGHLMTAEEALDAAYMSRWNVRKQPLWTSDEDGHLVPVDDKVATIRTNPVNGESEYLGVVGTGYRVIQNEESTAFLDALVDESGAHFETVGALRGGKETFVTLRLPEYMQHTMPDGSVDTTDLYLAAMNHHDGYGSFRVVATPVRIVCANTQSAAIRGAKSSWSVRHTANALAAIEEARQSLRVMFGYADAFSNAVAAMIDRQCDDDEARRLLNTVFDVDHAPTERAQRGRQARVDDVMAGLELPTVASSRGTRYGVYNAVTEYIDHRMSVRGRKGVAPEQQIRGTFAEVKANAFAVLSA